MGKIIERSIFSFIWKYSKREQIVLLVVTASLFPLLYLTLELPKRIINDAIGAGRSTVNVFGFQIDQIMFLAILCVAFLLAVLAHGLLKMRINTMKGVLSERLLRRFRYTLIARILRFPKPYFERTSQGELVSMITSESEPMGGLMGDAVAQPALQAGQMLTILGFLFLQSFWFGLAACALIPLQAWVIPKMQRKINLLNKSRVIEVRALAAEIGESAAGASALRTNGGWRYRMAMITDRLGRLYRIRLEIFNKKFMMKFVNNFIGQLTPFFFFSVGGFLVIQGNVSLGALVAALAAYKDLSSPWKELLTYYNQVQDMSLRWDTITEKFAPSGMVPRSLIEGSPTDIPRLIGNITLDGVTVRDEDGNPVLEGLNVTLPAGAAIGISAPGEEDRRAFSDLLTREISPTQGRVSIAGHDLAKLHQGVIAARVGHASSRPVLFRGNFEDNVMMALKAERGEGDIDRTLLNEAEGAGNSTDLLRGQWLDPSIAGLENADELRDWWGRLVSGLGSNAALFRRGLDQKFDPDTNVVLAEQLVRLRPHVEKSVREAGLGRHVFFFDDTLYNPAIPVIDNLVFATRIKPITDSVLVQQTGFMKLLRDLGLDADLFQLTQDVVDMLRQIFGVDGTEHPLFRNLGIEPATFEATADLVEKGRSGGAAALSEADLASIMIIPFRISAEQIGPTFPEAIKTRILDLRRSHAQELQRRLDPLFAPLDARKFAPGLTVLENVLFGKISDAAGGKEDEIRNLISDALINAGAEQLVVDLVFDLPLSLGGANLPAVLAEVLALSRATLKRPDILIMDNALASFGQDTQIEVFKGLRELLPDTLLIYLNASFERPKVFDLFLELEQGRITSDIGPVEDLADATVGADLSRKLKALQQTELFSSLNRRELKLLAFGARWYEAPAGEYVFRKDDNASDGAYMLLEGQAGLYLPHLDGKDQLISTVGPGKLVGELGLIRHEPRALDMKAETDLLCLRIGAKEFLAVVENDAATAFKLLQVVASYVSN
ncbi:MAG: cyclic nucleotide-binding domain-containing protein [Paracoccaceae bacterium]